MATCAQEPLPLSVSAIRLYRLIACGDTRTAIALSEATSMTLVECQTQLRQLSRVGLIDAVPSSSTEPIRSSNPVLSIDAAIDAETEAVREQQRRVDELRQALLRVKEEVLIQRDQQRLVTVEVIDSRPEVVERLSELYTEAHRDLAIFLNNKQSAEALEVARERDRQLLRRGVRIRIVCLNAHITDPANRDYLRWFSNEGAQIRVTPQLPTRFVIQDSSVAVVANHPTDPTHGATVVTGAGMLAALASAFERTWEQSQVLESLQPNARRFDNNRLTQSHRDVLNLLSRGSKDAAIARQMAVSVRTVRRLIAEVSSVLEDPPNRFAMGVEAVRHGLIEDT